jgi:PAS domain S-box-containing protein
MGENVRNSKSGESDQPSQIIEFLNKLIENTPSLQSNLTEIIEHYKALLKENNSLSEQNQILSEENQKFYARFNEFLDNTLEGIYLLDADENYVLVNKTYAKMCGYTPEEMIESELKISDTWAIAGEKDLVLDEVKKKDINGIIIKYRRKDGSEGHQELLIRTRYNKEGEFIGYIGFANDVSDRVESLNAEVEARRRAEFLVDLMTHDINNVNQGTLMILEYILNSNSLQGQEAELLRMAVEQVNYTTELIKNVKKLQSVLEKPIDIVAVDPYPAIQVAAEAAHRAFPNKKLELTIGFNENQYHVLADSFLDDLFFNIFHNSLKHSGSKTVQIDVDVQPNLDSGHLEIHVDDYGPGIPDEAKKRILQRRLGAKGSGIGLTLVNYLIDRYDGYARVEDRVEGDQSSGSRFVLVLRKGR